MLSDWANPIHLFWLEQGVPPPVRETGPVCERPVPVFTLYKEVYGIERLAPERRGPHPASEEGKLELTEALRSNDRS